MTFCSRFFEDVSFGHVQRAWESDDERLLLSILNVTVGRCLS